MGRSLEDWTRDFLHAARALRRAPGFTIVTVVTLALAIGSNAAIFSVVDTVLIDPLPFPNADRLVSIWASAPGSDMPEEFGVGSEFFVQYEENADLLEDIGLFNSAQTTVRLDDRIDRLFIRAVNPSFFSTLGVAPVLGRLPTKEDAEGRVIVSSHDLWMNWFRGDPSVIDRTLEVSRRQSTIIGVMDPEFRFFDDRTSVWVHDVVTDRENLTPRGFGLGLVGRMRPGTDHASLMEQLAILASRLPERFGDSNPRRPALAA
jgi:hypothetical protein